MYSSVTLDDNSCTDDALTERVKDLMKQHAKDVVFGADVTTSTREMLEQICTDGVKCRVRNNSGKLIAGGVLAAGVFAAAGWFSHKYYKRKH